MELPGIVVFTFNRPQHVKQCIAALARNTLASQCDLTIYCDGPRHEQDVEFVRVNREFVRSVSGFKSVTVVERDVNFGCARSVIAGITESFETHQRLAIFEDDILTSPHTLSFLAASLEHYAKEPTVFSVSAWSPPPSLLYVPEYPFDAYFSLRSNIWGWATWRNRWQQIDWAVTDYDAFKENKVLQHAFNHGGADLTPMLQEQMEGRLNTWDIRMDYARFKHGCVGLNPVKSYTTNIGMGSGTHTTEYTSRWDNDVSLAKPADSSFRWPEHIFVDEGIQKRYSKAYQEPWGLRSCLRKLLNVFGVLEYARRLRNFLRRRQAL